MKASTPNPLQGEERYFANSLSSTTSITHVYLLDDELED